jgi:hypothetical protein
VREDEEAAGVVVPGRRIEGDGHDDVWREGFGGKDPHNGRRLAIEPDGSTQHAGGAVESFPPEAFAEQRDTRRARLLVARPECPAGHNPLVHRQVVPGGLTPTRAGWSSRRG